MAPTPSQTSLSLLSLLTLLILTRAKISTLDNSDHEVLLIVLRDLGLKTQDMNKNDNLCNINGVFCERRISDNSYVLRVTRILLDSRQLTGFLSPAIGRLSELREISLSNNQLVDRIPPHIVDCWKIEILNLENNLFSGEIFPEISSLARLRVLDLSFNKFSGEVPFSIGSFRRLQLFDISGNNFAQNVFPKRYILTESNSTIVVNSTKPHVKGRNSTISFAPAPAPTFNQEKNKHKHRNAGKMILGFLVGSIGGSVSGIIFSLLCKLLLIWFKGRERTSGPVIFSSLIKKTEYLDFLEDKEALSMLEVIGEGGCGKVYKAPLPGNEGRIIAIKKVIQPSRDAADLTDEDTKLLSKKMRQIRSEIRTVGHIRHRNLLPLLAHVPRPDCHYLVYEFMKNGSLQENMTYKDFNRLPRSKSGSATAADEETQTFKNSKMLKLISSNPKKTFIFGICNKQDLLTAVSQGDKELDWLARHKIALGVAAGLEYLHLNHTPRVIHRDLKPGNILLDDDMEARIADFGLAKVVPDGETHMTASNAAGTLGYIAPEYYQTLKLTEKCDIYSFGIIIGVLVTGKLPSDIFFHTNQTTLVQWMRTAMTSEEPKKAIDPKLMSDGYEEQMLLALKIACFCTVNDPKQRPDSKDVRLMLFQIEHNNPRHTE